MTQRVRNRLAEFSLLLAFGLALVMPQAHAGLISADEAQAQDERGRLTALIERPEVAKALERMGIAPHEAVARVGAMNDAEVRQLAGRLEALPAGGQLTNQELLLIVIVILLVIIIL